MTQTTPPSGHIGSFLAWVWAGLLILGGLGFLLFNTGVIGYTGPLILPLASGVALLSVPFFARWLARRNEWWALITAWVFLAFAILLFVIMLNPGPAQIVAMVALVEVSVPFWAIYLINRTRWWALVPAYALVVLALLLALTMLGMSSQAIGGLALLTAALPFWLIYMLDRRNWWALIPAGALSVVAIILLVALSFVQLDNRALLIILNGALAIVTFAIWLTIRRYDWALWLAIGFALGAIASIRFPAGTAWAIIALMMGTYIAYRQINTSQKQKMAGQQAQQPTQAVPASSAHPTVSPPAPTVQAAPAPPAPPPTPTPAQPPTGLQIDREATAGHQARRDVGAPQTGGPVVGFTPIDPFKDRRNRDEEGTEED